MESLDDSLKPNSIYSKMALEPSYLPSYDELILLVRDHYNKFNVSFRKLEQSFDVLEEFRQAKQFFISWCKTNDISDSFIKLFEATLLDSNFNYVETATPQYYSARVRENMHDKRKVDLSVTNNITRHADAVKTYVQELLNLQNYGGNQTEAILPDSKLTLLLDRFMFNFICFHEFGHVVQRIINRVHPDYLDIVNASMKLEYRQPKPGFNFFKSLRIYKARKQFGKFLADYNTYISLNGELWSEWQANSFASILIEDWFRQMKLPNLLIARELLLENQFPERHYLFSKMIQTGQHLYNLADSIENRIIIAAGMHNVELPQNFFLFNIIGDMLKYSFTYTDCGRLLVNSMRSLCYDRSK